MPGIIFLQTRSTPLGAKKTSGIVVQDYLRLYPSMSSRRLAELICKEVPAHFKDPEATRRVIRYYRGAAGDVDRVGISPADYMPRVLIPMADEEDFSPYILPDTAYPIIAGGDAHVPYHDQDALEIFIERAVKICARTVLLAGDWLDCYQISRYLKDPRKRSIKGEIDTFKTILDTIAQALPDAKIIFKVGNHEERYDAYLMANAPALFDLDYIHLDKILELKERGIEYVTNKRIIKAGHLHIIHGHEYIYSISNPVNPARGLYNRAKKSALCFHHHQTSEHTEPAINGDIVTTWSGGCLCGLRPQYMPLNKWNHGFTEIYNSDGFFTVSNRRIINYRIV